MDTVAKGTLMHPTVVDISQSDLKLWKLSNNQKSVDQKKNSNPKTPTNAKLAKNVIQNWKIGDKAAFRQGIGWKSRPIGATTN